MKQASLVLNGKIYLGRFRDGYMLCADGGYDMVKAKGIVPDGILGDMDSILTEPDENIPLIKYDAVKDSTDGELALRYLIEQGFDDIVIYGAEGGRLDHILTNINLLALSLEHNIKIHARCNDYDIYLSKSKFTCEVNEGDELSIVPFSDEVHIIKTKGLMYPLKNETLFKSASRGLSNVATSEQIEIEIGEGVCFIFRLFH